jgi:hypothetical protein
VAKNQPMDFAVFAMVTTLAINFFWVYIIEKVSRTKTYPVQNNFLTTLGMTIHCMVVIQKSLKTGQELMIKDSTGFTNAHSMALILSGTLQST